MAREHIAADQVRVWLADPASDVTDLEAILGDEERERMGRFRFDRDRRSFLVSHALVRRVLSRYEDLAPNEWRFVATGHGKPEIHPDHGSSLRFNLSHTDGLIACGVARHLDIGVDVENTTRRIAVDEIAEGYLAPTEAADLRSLADDQRRRRFFTYWTLKEAYLKANGMGLGVPLHGFAIRLGEDGAITIDGPLDEAQSWHFLHATPTPTHSLGVAVRRDGEVSITTTDQRP